MRASAERGQAQIEAVVAIVVLLLSVAFAVKAVGSVGTVLVADAATHAGALAQAAGGDGASVARRALPGGLRAAARVRVRDGEVRVRMPFGGSAAFSRVPGG